MAVAKSEYAKQRLAEIRGHHASVPAKGRRPAPTRAESKPEAPRDFMPTTGVRFARPQYTRIMRPGNPEVHIRLSGFVPWRRPRRVLPLDQLRSAGLRATGPGIYFLWRGPELVYIGQSLCVPDRLFQHQRARDGLASGKRMQFIRATSIPCAATDLTEIEYEYICTYGPPFNDKWCP